MKKRKLKKKVLLLIIILLFAIICFFVGKRIYIKLNTFNVKVVDEIKGYSYSLDDRDTELYKSYFNELKSILSQDEVDYEQYALIVSKMFIIDLYTLENKVNKYDIPCLEFVYPSAKDNFKLKVQDTLYKYIEDNTNKKRSQVLPIVKSVEKKSVESGKFKLGDSSYDAYVIKLSWDYETDLGYDNNGTITIVKEDKTLYVAEYANK